MKSPLDFFFSLGDKVTGGDIKRKANWDYWMLIIMFVAFFSIMIDNLYIFIQTQQLYNLGWALVMLAILWFQYFGLKSAYEFRKMLRTDKKDVKLESEDEMLKDFKDEEPKESKEDKEIILHLLDLEDLDLKDENFAEKLVDEELSEETKKTFNETLKGGDEKNE